MGTSNVPPLTPEELAAFEWAERYAAERATLIRHGRRLAKESAGRIVLIHGDEILLFDDKIEAYRAGTASYGADQFLVRDVPSAAEAWLSWAQIVRYGYDAETLTAAEYREFNRRVQNCEPVPGGLAELEAKAAAAWAVDAARLQIELGRQNHNRH